MNIDRVVKELLQFKNDVIDGRYPQPTAMGPGQLDKNTIKSKTITSNMIDVSNLQSVSTKTGTLSVDGAVTVGTNGSIASGKTGYTDNVNPGFWLGVEGAVAKMNVGGSTYGITWNGTSLVIKGEITATTGAIGGWSIGATDLTTDTGKTGMSSSGSYRLWVNASNAADLSTAVFSVNSSGLLKSTSANIGGWTIDANGLYTGSSTTERGISSSTGTNTFYAGGGPASAPFRVSKEGKLTASNIEITGGTLNIGSGAFTVSAAGAMKATSADISGKIVATDGTIGGVTITANKIGGSGWEVTNAGVMTSTSGSVGGLTINANDLTIPSGKKLKFGSGGNDYLDDNVLYFNMSTSETGKVKFGNSSYQYYYSQLAGYVTSSRSFLQMSSFAGNTSGNKWARVYADGYSTLASAFQVYDSPNSIDHTFSLTDLAIEYKRGTNTRFKVENSSTTINGLITFTGASTTTGITGTPSFMEAKIGTTTVWIPYYL